MAGCRLCLAVVAIAVASSFEHTLGNAPTRSQLRVLTFENHLPPARPHGGPLTVHNETTQLSTPLFPSFDDRYARALGGYRRALQAGSAGAALGPACTRAVDVMFVLDASGSIGLTNFQLALQFVMDVSAAFQFGTNGARMGVAVFSDDAGVSITLDDAVTGAAFADLVQQLPYWGGKCSGAALLRMGRARAPDDCARTA